MNANEYHFISRWRVEGTCGEVADVLGDVLSLSRWWPSVYLDVIELRPPDARGLERKVALHTRGWLPYSLRWEFEIVESRYPHGFTLVATGDFDGRGMWTFERDDAFVNITFDWRIRAEKPLLQHLSFLMKPLFEANHRWAMAQGEGSLKLELARRRATSDAARVKVPAPPGPVIYSGAALVAGVMAVGGLLTYLAIRARRKTDG